MLSDGAGIDDVALHRLLALTALHSLALRGCTALSDISLCALGAKLTALRDLDLSCCHEV